MADGKNSYFHRRYWPAWLTLVAGLSASAGLGWKLDREAVVLDRQRLERIAKVVLDQLDGRVEKTEWLLRQAQDYFGAQSDLTPVLFRDWIRKRGLSLDFPWVHGFALYTNKNAGAWRSGLPPELGTWTGKNFDELTRDATGTPVELEFGFGYPSIPGKRWPTNYLWRLQFETVINEDTGSPHGSIIRDQPKSTGRQAVIIHPKKGVQFGAALVLPLYTPDRDALRQRADALRPKPDLQALNWNLCRGVLFAPIDYVQLESQMRSKQPREVGVEIFASAQPQLESWLNPTVHAPRALDALSHPYLTATKAWRMYQSPWTVFIYTRPSFEAQSPRRLARIAAAAGTAMTLLATLLVGVALRASSRQEGMTGQIREARDALATAQQERQKLSHDLHDNTIQTLYAIQLRLSHTRLNLEAEPAHAWRELATVGAELDGVIADLRRFILAEESEEKAADLSEVLRAMVDRSGVATKTRLELRCEPAAAERLADNQAVQLANIAREALSNSLRHARPQLVQIVLRSEGQAVCLEVSDDGVGFDARAQPRRGVGLTSMSARAQESGGSLEILSAPDRGTRLVVRVPVSPAEPVTAMGAGDDEDEM